MNQTTYGKEESGVLADYFKYGLEDSKRENVEALLKIAAEYARLESVKFLLDSRRKPIPFVTRLCPNLSRIHRFFSIS
eukprot:UN25188